MVATWNAAAASSYYTRRRETDYYVENQEPEGIWYAPGEDFGLADESKVNRRTFERLYAGQAPDGRSLLERVRRHAERIPAFDITLSAPRSVSLAWAFSSGDDRIALEAAQYRAVRATLDMLEREAMWARRGRNGMRIEKVALTAATFRHGESRAARHADGAVFGDPNLHTHSVIFNLATRPDGTVGAIHSKVLRDFKMAAGATYHAALAYEVSLLGYGIDRVGKNGVFELAGVDEDLIRYFSARRNEIEDELARHGASGRAAPAFAAAIAKASRSSKRPHDRPREEVWTEAGMSLGVDIARFGRALREPNHVPALSDIEVLIAERLALLPSVLTEHDSVIERRELIRAVAASLVGTGLPVDRAQREIDRLVEQRSFIEIGRDPLGLPVYSTPEVLKIEREVVQTAQRLATIRWKSIDRMQMAERCRAAGLNPEQSDAVLAATSGSAIAIIEGAPGAGKTTTLKSIADAYHATGSKVLGSAQAWRIASMLRDDLSIESRSTASWIATIEAGQKVMNARTVLIVDEAGLLSSRQMHALLGAVVDSGAKLLLVGDRQQLQAIGAGPGLDLVARAVATARVDTIVRQKHRWARDAVAAFGKGEALAALEAFSARNLLIEGQGPKSTIDKILEQANPGPQASANNPVLILAKSNAAVAAISRQMRTELRTRGQIRGHEVAFLAATPSGHSTEIALAEGDRIRFLVRNDDLRVINGSAATVLKVRKSRLGRIRIHIDLAGRKIAFDPMILADSQGRPRIGWAYASTIAGAQGMTVDRAVVLVDASFNRHDIYVASSRARETTTLVIDSKSTDARMSAELPIDRQRDDLSFTELERRQWIAQRLGRSDFKMSTIDVIEQRGEFDLRSRSRAQTRGPMPER